MHLAVQGQKNSLTVHSVGNIMTSAVHSLHTNRQDRAILALGAQEQYVCVENCAGINSSGFLYPSCACMGGIRGKACMSLVILWK